MAKHKSASTAMQPAAQSVPPAPMTFPATSVAPGAVGGAPIGKIRSTGVCIGLFILTFGIYGLIWNVKVHGEMKAHRGGKGLGGVGAFFLTFLPVLPFLTPSKVGQLYQARGWQAPVSGTTGFFMLIPGVGGLLWFSKTNGALNDYWTALGAK